MDEKYPTIKARLPKGTDKDAVKAGIKTLLLKLGAVSPYHKNTYTPSLGLYLKWLAQGKVISVMLSPEQKRDALNTLKPAVDKHGWIKPIVDAIELSQKTSSEEHYDDIDIKEEK